MLDLPLAWWAPLGFGVYAAVSLVVGSRFPFSKYAMYDTSPNRTRGAVPVVLADGEVASLAAFDRIDGFTSAEMYPPGIPCSLEWQVREAQRWVDEHPLPAGEGPGPVRLAWGFRQLTLRPDHEVEERLEILCTGTAWTRG